eukprot:CAMPEP_0181116394 /NCGR_PEP_ID=MMETSP1071-20121207/21928_1 /TAXON_ID=35127 /ORGANISM="Thalassiosira sp., Strain NH16" /LENGTH=380 /DNA_ID=CAMNT_0023200637 /DNA_START=80 /DNA_END=1222 /DNA_ORIENTATION=-
MGVGRMMSGVHSVIGVRSLPPLVRCGLKRAVAIDAPVPPAMMSCRIPSSSHQHTAHGDASAFSYRQQHRSPSFIAGIASTTSCRHAIMPATMDSYRYDLLQVRRQSILLTQQHQQPQQPQQQQQQRQLATRPRRGSKKKRGGGETDPDAPLINEHLIAELFNIMKGKQGEGGGGGGQQILSADTYEVRLIVDRGFDKKKAGSGDDAEESDAKGDEATTTPAITTQVVTLNRAITIAHEHALDLMEVAIRQSPPVLKAISYDRYNYDLKKQRTKARSLKRREGGGAISDRPLKEFKFRAGIADHDLMRKARNMIGYIEKGHAVRVTLTARQRSLNADAAAIETTLGRVKELVGDRAVEARVLKANDRKSYGSLLLHPNKGK